MYRNRSDVGPSLYLPGWALERTAARMWRDSFPRSAPARIAESIGYESMLTPCSDVLTLDRGIDNIAMWA
jgi:hypothetical protein